MMVRPVRLSSTRLAQGAPPATRIVVIDTKGHPVSGASVSASIGTGKPVAGETDSSGVASLALPQGAGDVTISAGQYAYVVPITVPYRGDVFVTLPVCMAQPFVTTPEILTLLAGVAVTAAGYHWKFEPAKVTGEVLMGAAVFTAIYRLSCL